MSLPTTEDRKRKRVMLEQGNPELNVAAPGVKRQLKIGLGAQKLSVPDAEQTVKGVKTIQNESKEKSKDVSNNMFAYTGGWRGILSNVFASENESPEFRAVTRMSSGYLGSVVSSASININRNKELRSIINFNKEGKCLVLLENQIGAELPWALIKQSEAKDIIFLEG